MSDLFSEKSPDFQAKVEERYQALCLAQKKFQEIRWAVDLAEVWFGDHGGEKHSLKGVYKEDDIWVAIFVQDGVDFHRLLGTYNPDYDDPYPWVEI